MLNLDKKASNMSPLVRIMLTWRYFLIFQEFC